jgi:hypothetical protein
MRRLLILALLLAACAREQPATDTAATSASKPAPPPAPSMNDAENIIKGSPNFGEYQFTHAGWTAPVSGARMSEPVRAEAKQLAAKGWIAFDGAGDLMLTEKGRNDRRFLMRENGILDIVPMAKKEFGRVEAVRDENGKVFVDFTWRWLPNEVGVALESGPSHDRWAAHQQATAELIHDGTNWTLLSIKSR